MVHACAKSARPFTDANEIRNTHEEALTDLLKDYDLPELSLHLPVHPREETPMNAIIHCQNELHTEVTLIGALSRARLAELIIGNTASRVPD